MFRSTFSRLAAMFMPPLLAMAALSLAAPGAIAQSPAPVSATPAGPTKKIAVLAAVGDQMQLVRRRLGVGSHLEPFVRQWVTVPDQTLNKMVLRGMDRAITAEYPNAEVVYLMLTPDAKERELRADQREAEIFRRALAMLEPVEARKGWDEILVVSPKWLFPENAGMASKLTGIGIFIQPIESARNAEELFESGLVVDVDGEQVRDPGKFKQSRSQTYVAPFFYMKVTVLDARTLRVIRTDERYDFRRLINSDSTALNVAASIPLDMLADQLTQFVEASARRLVVDRPGTIDIGPLRTTPAPAWAKP
ncbi:MAG: hypothetical protein ACK4XK_04725 [Casimicrobiaceae bacterium]